MGWLVLLNYRLTGTLLMTLALVVMACDDNGSDTQPPNPTQSSNSAVTQNPLFPLVVLDSAGTEVTLSESPMRIISYSPGATEILFAIGAGDRVIATDEFSDFPIAANQLDKLSYMNPDPERALTLEPDLLIMAGIQREQIEQFRSLGMTVLFIKEAATIDGVLEDISRFGDFTNNQARAAELNASLRSRIDAISLALANTGTGPRVFFEITSDLYTVSSNTFVGDLLTLANAQNIAANAESPFPQLSAEAIVASNPEVILLADGEFGENFDTVCARPGWEVISACINQRVHPVDGDLTSRPGPRVVDGLELIVRLLYPEYFQ